MAYRTDRLDRAIERKSRSRLAAESIGYHLHNLYCACHYRVEFIAEALENNLSDRRKYHLEPLRRMAVPIKGVRPALLSQQTYLLLDNLRASRHFSRHAYLCDLDERKVPIVLADALALKDQYPADVKAFLGRL